MHGTIAAATPPVTTKRRTITLTNRSPITIDEDEWPIAGKGVAGVNVDYGWQSSPYGWEISFHVRFEKKEKPYPYQHRAVIQAKFHNWDESEVERCQTIRVGRLLDANEAACELWKHMLEVGDELRARIDNEHMHKDVMHALDQCFASLSPDHL